MIEIELLPNPVPALFDRAPDVQPKSNEQVCDDGGAKRGKRKVDKIHPHPCRSYAHLVAEVAAYAEGGMFHKIS